MSIKLTKVFIEGHTLDRGNEGAIYLMNIIALLLSKIKMLFLYWIK